MGRCLHTLTLWSMALRQLLRGAVLQVFSALSRGEIVKKIGLDAVHVSIADAGELQQPGQPCAVQPLCSISSLQPRYCEL